MFTSSIVVSSFDIEQYFPPPLEARRFPLLLRGEFGLFDIEARGTGLVKPMLLLPLTFPPDETVMVTGEEDGEEAVFTIFLLSIPSQFPPRKKKKKKKTLPRKEEKMHSKKKESSKWAKGNERKREPSKTHKEILREF